MIVGKSAGTKHTQCMAASNWRYYCKLLDEE